MQLKLFVAFLFVELNFAQVITQFPYLESFENGDGGWTSQAMMLADASTFSKLSLSRERNFLSPNKTYAKKLLR